MIEVSAAIAQRMREIVGAACLQHQENCEKCNSSDIFMCGLCCYLLALKFYWLRKVQELKHD